MTTATQSDTSDKTLALAGYLLAKEIVRTCGASENWNGDTRSFVLAAENLVRTWEAERWPVESEVAHV